MNEMTRLQKRIVSTSIQPCETTTEHFNIERILLKIDTVHISDFQLSTLGRLDVLGYLDNLIVVEVQTCYGVVGLRL
ncbi:hypothetical protein D3C81_2080020 [compost metagenome]